MMIIRILIDALYLLLLIWAAIIDIKKREIPNAAVIGILVLGVTVAILSASIFEHLLGLALALPLIILGLKGHMGGGDYKLILGTGLYLGLTQSLAAVVLSLPATIFVAIYILARQRTLKGIRIPLAPIIVFGCIASVLLKWVCK